jgi:hypothetical protein
MYAVCMYDMYMYLREKEPGPRGSEPYKRACLRCRKEAYVRALVALSCQSKKVSSVQIAKYLL